MIGDVVNQYAGKSRRLAVMSVLLVMSRVGHDAAQSACCSAGDDATEYQQAQLRLSDLEWSLAVNARDVLDDPIQATHLFFRAAKAAHLAGDESRATSFLIAASFPSQARDRYLIHPVHAAVFSPDSRRLLTYDNGPVAWLWDVGSTEPLQSFRHEKDILAANFNNDATRILSYSSDGTVRFWKIGQAEPLLILRHDAAVTGATLAAGESRILSWSGDKAYLWDVMQPNQPLLTFRHEGSVTGAVFNADETKLLTSGDDNTARLWNAKTGEMIHKLISEPLDHLDAWMKTKVTDAVFRDNESKISFSCYEGIWLWDAASGKLIDKFSRDFTGNTPRFISQEKGVVAFYNEINGKPERTFHHGLEVGHELDVKIAAFNDDRTRFLTRLDWRYYGHTQYGWVQLWETDGSKPLRTCRHEGIINGAALMKHSAHILSYSDDGTARLWDASQGNAPRTIRHRRPVTGALLSPNEKLLLTWTDRGTARLTELNREDGGQVLGRLKPEYPGHFAWTSLPPTGLSAITWGAYEKTFRHVDVARKETLRTFTVDGDLDEVIVSPDGSHVLAWGDRGLGWLWNVNNEQPTATLDGARTPIVFNKDASQVFYQTNNGGILYDVKRRTAVKKFVHVGDQESIARVVFTAESIRIFTRELLHLRLWDIDGDAPLRTFERDKRIEEVVFSVGGGRFITWSDKFDENVHLWDADHSEPRHTFRRKDDFSQAVFSADAARILSWSFDSGGAARLWDAETGSLLRTFRPHGHIVSGVFNADGNRVLTVTWDNKAHLWDFNQEEPLRTFHHTKMIERPAFADGGGSLIAQSDDKVMRWNIAIDRNRTIERQQRDYEVRTATRLDPSGRLLPLSLEEWRRLSEGEDSPDRR